MTARKDVFSRRETKKGAEKELPIPCYKKVIKEIAKALDDFLRMRRAALLADMQPIKRYTCIPSVSITASDFTLFAIFIFISPCTLYLSLLAPSLLLSDCLSICFVLVRIEDAIVNIFGVFTLQPVHGCWLLLSHWHIFATGFRFFLLPLFLCFMCIYIYLSA